LGITDHRARQLISEAQTIQRKFPLAGSINDVRKEGP
jgi:hypothetical protein